MRFFLALLLAALIPLTVHARAMIACTEIGCQQGVNVDFGETAWPAGKYTFMVRADKNTVTCATRLPFNGCEGNTTCSGKGISIGESGCAMPPETHAFSGIMFDGAPKSVAVTILHESGKSFSFSKRVALKCSYPNGRQCDPRPCCSANISVTPVFKTAPKGK